MHSARLLVLAALVAGCDPGEAVKPGHDYDVATPGTREFAFGGEAAAGRIRVLVEASNLGSDGAEVAEIFFPPGYHGTTHPHELEIIYVLEGELDHIVNGESNLLGPGMVGIVREPDLVVHRAASADGVRVLVIWPRGGEVAGLAASGMPETPIALP